MHAMVLLPESVRVQLLETTNGDWWLFGVIKIRFSSVTVTPSPVTTTLIVPFVDTPVIVWSPDEIVSNLELELYSQLAPKADLPPKTGLPSIVSMSDENSILPSPSIWKPQDFVNASPSASTAVIVIAYCLSFVGSSQSVSLPLASVQRSLHTFTSSSMTTFVTLQFASPMSKVAGNTALPLPFFAAGETASLAVNIAAKPKVLAPEPVASYPEPIAFAFVPAVGNTVPPVIVTSARPVWPPPMPAAYCPPRAVTMPPEIVTAPDLAVVCPPPMPAAFEPPMAVMRPPEMFIVPLSAPYFPPPMPAEFLPPWAESEEVSSP